MHGLADPCSLALWYSALIPTASPSDPDDFSGWRNRAHVPAPLISLLRVVPGCAWAGSPAGPMRACRSRIGAEAACRLCPVPRCKGMARSSFARPEARNEKGRMGRLARFCGGATHRTPKGRANPPMRPIKCHSSCTPNDADIVANTVRMYSMQVGQTLTPC